MIGLLYTILNTLFGIASSTNKLSQDVQSLKKDVASIKIEQQGIVDSQASLTSAVSALTVLETQNNQLLEKLLSAVTLPPAVGFIFTTILEGKVTERADSMQMTDTQQTTASITPVDAKGQPAQVQAGSVQWTGPAFVTLTPSTDGMSCLIVANGIGSGQVQVSADADLGAGVTTITGTLQVDVVGGQAVGFTINTSAPVEQPPAGGTPTQP